MISKTYCQLYIHQQLVLPAPNMDISLEDLSKAYFLKKYIFENDYYVGEISLHDTYYISVLFVAVLSQPHFSSHKSLIWTKRD